MNEANVSAAKALVPRQRLDKVIRDTRIRRDFGLFPRNDLLLVGCAVAILNDLLGERWVEKNILEGSSGFLGTPGHLDDVRLQSRICSLAEMFYNLADVKGFEGLLSKFQAAEKRESYEAAYSELESARLLKCLKIPFSIRTPSSRRGDSYDFDVFLSEQNIPCDSKCKIEGNNVTENSIYNPIHASSDQFPEDSPYWLIIKLPIGWNKEKKSAPELDSIAKRAFRNHSRFIAVIFHWEQVDGDTSRGFKWKIATDGYLHPDAHERFPSLVQAMRRIPRTDEYEWTSLIALLGIQPPSQPVLVVSATLRWLM